MASLINKLLGRDDESESHSSSHGSSSKTDSSHSASGGAAHGQASEGRTVQIEGVNIKSTISTDGSSTVSMANQQKLNDLVTRLGSTHSQVDEYAKKQTAKINDQVQHEIDQVVARTRREQDELLRRANEHTAQIDTEYRARLQKMVEEVDAAKATRIADIEKQLNDQQNTILQKARAEIDQLNQQAASMKIDVLQQAQVKAAADASSITAQAASLGQTSTVHQSKGTTTIKTEVSAATTTKETDTTTSHGTSSSSSGSHGTSGSSSGSHGTSGTSSGSHGTSGTSSGSHGTSGSSSGSHGSASGSTGQHGSHSSAGGAHTSHS